MAIYRQVYMTFWTDPKVDDDFTPEDKYFYLYLLTNPHTSVSGCYEISMRQMEWETGYDSDTIRHLLNRMERVHDIIRYDQSTKEILLLNWHKYNWTKSADFMKNVRKAIESVKSESFRAYLTALVDGNTVPTPSQEGVEKTHTVSVSVSVPVTVPVEERVSEEKGKRSKRFVPPTLEEVEAYCKERNSPVDPRRFHDYFSEGKWKDSKGNPVRNWKQKLITWEVNSDGSKRDTKPDAAWNISYDD